MKPFQITIEHLYKSFGSLSVLEDVSLTLESGRAYCLMGASGSGKTTLLRILLGLEKADSGRIRIQPEQPLRAVFQEDRLCEAFTPLDNVMLAVDRSSAAVRCMASCAGCCRRRRSCGLPAP